MLMLPASSLLCATTVKTNFSCASVCPALADALAKFFWSSAIAELLKVTLQVVPFTVQDAPSVLASTV